MKRIFAACLLSLSAWIGPLNEVFAQCAALPAVQGIGSNQFPNSPCSQVNANLEYSIRFFAPIPLPGEVAFLWGDGTTNTVIPVAAGQQNITVVQNHLFPANSDCEYQVQMFFRYNNSGNCATTRQVQIIKSWRTDAFNQGNVQLISPASNTTVHEVCEGVNIDIIFEDRTTFNCNSGYPANYVAGTILNPNEQIRWQQIVYNTPIAGTKIPNVSVVNGGVPQLVVGPGGVDAIANYQDPRGVHQLPSPVVINDPDRRNSLQITAPGGFGPGFPTIGQEFEVTIRYWNFCNPYANDFDNTPVSGNILNGDNPPVETTALIRIIDAPASPAILDRDICSGDATTLTVNPTSGTLTYRWYPTQADALARTNLLATGTTFTPTDAQAPIGQRTHFFVTAGVTAALGNCRSFPTEVQLIRRAALTSPTPIVGPVNLCPNSTYNFSVASSPTNITITDPTASPDVTLGTEYIWTVPAGWTINSGNGTNTISVTTGGVAGGNVTVDRRYTSAPVCNATATTQAVNVRARPTVNITPDPANICEGSTVQLNGNPTLPAAAAGFTPTISANSWGGAIAILDDATIQQPTVQASTAAGAYGLTYSVTANFGSGVTCTSTTDNSTVNVSANPTLANAGTDQNLCIPAPLDATLNGSDPAPGTGTWTRISGPGAAPTFTPNANTRNAVARVFANGVHVFRWTVVNGSCTSFDDVSIDYGTTPPASAAGTDQDVCTGFTATLNGNDPTFATGTWTQTAGPGTTTFTPNANTRNATATVTAFGTYTYRWRLSSGTCAASDDFVDVIYRQTPTVTGPADFTVCVDNPPTVTIPLSGTFGGGASQARWERVTGTGTFTSSGGANGNFDNSSPATDVYTPTAADFTAGSVQVRLVSDDPVGACVAVNDPVTITIDRRPANAAAGGDFSTCDATASLAATAATNGGTGTWSVGNALYYETFTYTNGTGLSGPNPHALTFTHPSNAWSITAPNANTLLANDDYLRVEGGIMEARDVNAELVWRSNAINITAIPNVSVSIQLSETGPMEGTDYIRAFYRLNGIGAEIPIGSIVGNSAPDNGPFATFSVSGLSGTSIEIIVRILNEAADEFYRFDNVFVSGAGAVLPFITNVNSPTTSITGLPVGNTTFTWTVTSALGVCSSSNDQVIVTRHASPVNNNQTPALCEDAPGSGDAMVAPAFLATLNDGITGIVGSTNRIVRYYLDAGRTVEFTTPNSLSNGEIVYTRVTRTDVTPQCTTDGTVTFTINTRPTAVALNPEYCEDLPVGSNTKAGINLTLLNDDVKNNIVANTVAWFISLGPDVPVPDPTSVTANDGTSFFARVTDGNGCTNEAEIEIQLNPIPPPNVLVGPTDVCVDASAVTLYQLTVNNVGYTYTWSIPEPPFDRVIGGTATDFLVLLSFPVVVDPGQNISVTETSDKGCVGLPNVKNIRVDTSPPAITIVGPSTVCQGESGVVYSVANLANTTYSWTVPPGSSIIAGQGTFEITVNFGSIPGLISVTPTTTTGCAGNPDDHAVAINPRPSLDVLANTVCSDTPAGITLSGTGASTFNITNVSVPPGLSPASRPLISGAIASEIFNDVFTNTTGGNLTVQYSVVPVSAANCEGSAQIVNLTIRPEPVLASGLNDEICSTVDAIGIVLSVASGSFPADQYDIFSMNIPPGLTQVAGIEAGPGPYTSGVLLDDKWENTTGAPAVVEYFIRPINSATGCVGDPPIAVMVTVNPEPIVPAMLPETICSGDTPATIITPSIPGSTFSWTVVSVSGLITGNTSGTGPSGSAITDVLINNGMVPGSVTYAITATAPGAMGSCSGQAVNLVVNVNPAPTANNISQTVCSDTPGGNTFFINLTTLQNTVNSGGGVTFTWSENISMVPPIATPTAYTLTSGVPVFVEVDNGQCTKIATVLYTINPSPSVVATITSNYNGFQLSCNGASDGQITAVPANGTGPYLFSIDGGGSFFTSGIFNGLSVAGNNYTVRVRDANFCFVNSTPLTFIPPAPVSAVAAITSNYNGEDVSCQAASDGVITITPAGGTGTYTFKLLELPSNTTGDATGVYTGLRAGAYTFVVRDANNCQFTLPTITVTEPSPVTASAVLTSPVSCNGNTDGVITVTAAGGTLTGLNYNFTLNQPPGTVNTTGVFSGLAAGNYTVNVVDDNGCPRTSNIVTVTQPSVLTAFASVTSNFNGAKISCPGANDAQITAIANGGNGGYTYVLDQDPLNITGQSDGTFDGLGPGTYTVTVTDAGTCSVTSASVTIAEPTPIVAAASVTGTISCNGGNDGQITVTALGGTGAYSFEQINPAGPTNASGIFSALSQGTYDFEVSDLNGCSDIVTLTINEPTTVTASAAVTSNYNGAQISCNGANNGVITVTGAGGTGALTYVFDQFALSNTTGQFTGVFTGVPAGTGYTFTVRDSKNCTIVTLPISVTQPTVVAASGSVTSNYNGEDISCVGSSDGQITVSASGGTGTYTYKLDQVPANTSGDATGIYTGLSAGIYTVTARDVNNCFIVTAPITITAPTPLTANAAVTSNYNGRQISCNGASDGIITVTPAGGVGGYNYLLVEIPGNVSGAATGIFTGVPAGTYSVRVRDLNTCQVITTSVTISQPAIVAASAAVTSNYNGQQLSCNGSTDATIRVTASGGTLPYTYAFVEIPLNTTGQATGIFTGIPAGTYTFTVRDVNNCLVTTTSVTVTPPTIVVGSAAVTSNYNGAQISCNGLSDGVITITASGGTGLLQYTFVQIPANTIGQFSGIFSGVPAGTGYTFSVRDANNCTIVTAPINVTEPTAVGGSGNVTSNYNGEDISCFGTADGQITITGNNGTGAYTFKLDQAPSNTSGDASGIYSGLSAGSYTVTVRDVNNCFAVTPPIVVTSPTVVTASGSVTSNYNGRQITCNGASDGIITIVPGGGVPTYSYVLNEIPGNITGATSGIFMNLPAGTYTVTVRDLNLCARITTSIVVTEPTVVTASSAITSNYNGEDVSCNGSSDGIIRVTPAGGTTPYAYAFVEIPGNATGATSGTFTGIPAGTYTFNVLDVNNCPVTTLPITVTEPTPVSASAAVTSNYSGSQISCNGINDGVITVTSGGGTGSATYVFDQFSVANQTGRFSGVFTSVPAGTGYTFTVRDANNCPVVTTVIDVTQPAALNASGLATSDFNGFDVRCFTETNGQITVTAAGGTGTLEFMLLEDAGNMTGVNTGVFDNMRAGSFRARITDDNGCLFTTTPIIVTQPNNIALAISITSNFNGFNISCAGANDGQITVTSTTGGASGYTYALDGFPGNTTGQTNGIFTGLVAGLYTITVTDVNTCSKQSLPVILTDPLPLFEGIVGLDKSVCLGGDPTAFTQLAAAFGGIGNYTYQWQESTDNATFSDVGGATNPTFDPPAVPQTTFYKRLITSGTCVTLESNTVTVTVNPLPTVALAPSKTPVCEGDFFLLEFTFTGQAPFFFDFNDGTTFVNDRLGAANTPVPVLNYANTTTYTVTEVRDFNGCVAPILPPPVIVPVVRINPDFTITSSDAQCSGAQFDFEFTVDPDVDYTWIWNDGQPDTFIPANSLPVGTQNISHIFSSFNPNGTTNVPVVLTAINSVNGCGPKQALETISVFSNVLVNISADKDEICGGDKVTFTNVSSGGPTHEWIYRVQGSGTVIGTRNPAGPTNEEFLLNNTTTQNPLVYEVLYEITNPQGCSADTLVEITVYREVDAAFLKTTPIPEFIGGIANMTFTNDSDPIDGTDFRYSWDFGNGATQPPVDGLGPFNFNYTSFGTKTVLLVATNVVAEANGVTCTNQYQESFTILLPALRAGFEYTPQALCFPANIQITRNLATGNVFEWRLRDQTGRTLLLTNDTLPTFNISSPGRYTVTLTTRNTVTGQSATAENNGAGNNVIAGDPSDATDFNMPVDIYPAPFAAFEALPKVLFVPDEEMRTFNSSISPTDPTNSSIVYPMDYRWNFDDGTPEENAAEPTHTYHNEGNYDVMLIVSNDHGNGIVCTDTMVQTITAKAQGFTRVPNAFTPNPSGPTGGIDNGSSSSRNDIFLPIMKGVKEFQMQIFDRWGNLVFESRETNRGWDGYDRNGILMPSGVYVYKLVLRLANDQRTTQIGDVTLIR